MLCTVLGSTPCSMLAQVRVELYDVRRTKFIAAHTGALAALALSLDGKLLATASVRGTLVRIHSTTDGSKLRVRTRHAPMPSMSSDLISVPRCNVKPWNWFRCQPA